MCICILTASAVVAHQDSAHKKEDFIAQRFDIFIALSSAQA